MDYRGRGAQDGHLDFHTVQIQCCFTSTETVRTIRDREHRTVIWTFTQLLSSVSEEIALSPFMLAYTALSHTHTHTHTHTPSHQVQHTSSLLGLQVGGREELTVVVHDNHQQNVVLGLLPSLLLRGSVPGTRQHHSRQHLLTVTCTPQLVELVYFSPSLSCVATLHVCDYCSLPTHPGTLSLCVTLQPSMCVTTIPPSHLLCNATTLHVCDYLSFISPSV